MTPEMEYPRKRGLVHDYLFKRSTGIVKPWSIFETVRGSRSFVQRLELLSVLRGHDGCVNSVTWNENGSLLLSGSDDCFLNIYEPWSKKCLYSLRSGHTANIFSAKFLPSTSDRKLVSCSGDGVVHYNELENESYHGQHPFRCHVGTTYEVLVTPGDPHTFMTCGEDGTVREFDLRVKNKCICNECTEDILIDCSHAVTSMSINPLVPFHIAVGCEDSNVRIFDRRSLGTSQESRSSFVKDKVMRGMFARLKPEKLRSNRCRVTSLQYSQGGHDLLVSYCADYVYLFSLDECKNFQMRTGHDAKTLHGGLAEEGDDLNGSSNLPPLKRLRLRGDWSDTGPNARPENEQGESSESSLLQRMSEVFTSWLEDAFRASVRSTSSSGDSSQGEEARSEEPRSAVRGRLFLGSVRNNERRSRAMRGSNRSQTNSTDSERHVLRLPSPFSEPVTSSMSENAPHEIGTRNPPGPEHDRRDDFATRVDYHEASDNESVLDSTSSGAFNERLQGQNNSTFTDSTNFSDSHPIHSLNNGAGTLCPFQESQNSSTEMEETGGANPEVESLPALYNIDSLPTISTECRRDLSSDLPSRRNLGWSTLSDSEQVASREGLIDNQPVLNSRVDVSSATVSSSLESHNTSLHPTASNESNSFPNRDQQEEVHNTNRASRAENNLHRGSAHLDEAAAATRIQNFVRKHKESGTSRVTSFHLQPLKASKCYKGHRNARTMIKEANFWGDHFVISGSDCGRIFIWDRHTSELVTFMSGDRHVVNCVQPHPFDPVLASSGIDYDIKLWAPVLKEPNEMADFDEVIRRNEQMLEESRDTITVPASFMLRMLASLSHVRGRRRQQESMDSSDSDTED